MARIVMLRLTGLLRLEKVLVGDEGLGRLNHAKILRRRPTTMLALLDEPQEGAARQAFLDELNAMLSAYLLLPRPWDRDARAR